MILSSFTVIFTSVFQSNIELWIQFCFLFCGQIQLQVWRKCFSKEKTHCNEKKQVLQFHPSKVFQWPENFISNETSFVMMQDLLWTHQNFSFQNTVSFVGQDDKRIFSTHWKILSFFFNVGETFTCGIDSTDEHFTEGSLKKSRWLERTLQRSLFHYLQNFIQYNTA